MSLNNNALPTRNDFLKIIVLVLIALAIFYPLFYSEYLYTDEAVQLWLYRKGSGFQMFLPQGRFIADKLFQWLFSRAHTIHDVTFIRLFSFVGWIICIPVWYFVIKHIATREKLSSLLVFFSVLYLICTPPFSMYVSWASCLELFIANTAGLVSGYSLYSSLHWNGSKIKIGVIGPLVCVVFGIVSLFTYQNGFGCFFLPFLLNLISNRKNFRIILIGIISCLVIYVIYYFLFRYNLSVNNIGASDRTKISIDLFPKIRFFFGRALAISFHFTYLFNEKDLTGFFVYAVTFIAWLSADFYVHRDLPFLSRLIRFALILAILVLIYLPSLIIKENYSSNRTLLALNMAVFFLVANTLMMAIKKQETRVTVVAVLSFLFVLNARNNFSQQFLNPIKNEYRQVRNYLETNYNSSINTFYFIRPHEEFFVRKYHITRSWDEFGVPSTFFNWVPEFFVKQVIFEKTGDRSLAEDLIVKHWLGKEEFTKSAPQLAQNIMVIDTEEIMSH